MRRSQLHRAALTHWNWARTVTAVTSVLDKPERTAQPLGKPTQATALPTLMEPAVDRSALTNFAIALRLMLQ